MNQNDRNKQITSDQALIIAYLYDELSDERRQSFEQRLASDPIFNTRYQQQIELDKFIQRGSQPVIEKQRLDAVHWSLQKQLRKQANKQRSIFNLMINFWQQQVSVKVQFASMLATFVLGLLLAQGGLIDNDSTTPLTAQVDEVPLQFIQEDDFQITDMQLKKYDPQSDKVQVVYSLESRSRVDGSIANRDIQKLLASTLKNDVSDATRLDLVEVLKNYSEFEQIRSALGYSLLNDPNPGVRMVAAESLSQLTADNSVRQVLLTALQNDINPGVRVEVFQALVSYLVSSNMKDQDTLNVLQNYSVKDSNQYIRQQTENLLIEQGRLKENQI